jgi:ribonuclease HII
MINLDRQYPGYHFADHKGYVTRAHERSLNELGVTAIHRKSYANIQALINK